ncbi:DUF202 domain-containing protein [Microlunatus sp. Y2014]|uniref:DUF202 domain-containing protein n=1 Tax=Microlunatus sp. Y2014 TaxID=3418488 RepID=UPI003DA72EC1
MTDDGADDARPWEHHVWDRGLQAERTRLAWGRTGLAVTACTLVIARFVGTVSPVLGVLIAVAAMACGLMISLSSRRRHRRATRATHQSAVLPDARSFGWLSALLCLAGISSVVMIIVYRPDL